MTTIFGGAEVEEDKIPSPISFSKNVELLAINEDISLIEAVVQYCEQTSIELETVTPLLTPPLKEKIRVEAADKRLIKDKIRKLPI